MLWNPLQVPAQLVGDSLAVRFQWQHLGYELPDTLGERVLTILECGFANREPPLLDLLSGFEYPGSTRFWNVLSPAQGIGDGLDAIADVPGVAMALGAIDRIKRTRPSLAANDFGRRIGFHSERPQVHRELLTPFPQDVLSDIEADAVFAQGFDDDVHVRMGFVRVQNHRVPML